MAHRPLRFRQVAGPALAVLGLGAFLLAGAGCDEDPGQDDVRDRLYAHVSSEETGQPLAGVEVIAMDADSNLPLGDPVTSDANGICDLGPVRGAPPRLVVFGGPLWQVHRQPDWFYGFGKSGGGPRSARGNAARVLPAPGLPPGPVAPATPPDQLMPVTMRPRPVPGALPRFAGTIVDATTGRPLARAFIGLSPWPTGFGAGAAASDDVTGPGGTFTVYDIPVAIDGDTGIGFQVLPLVVTCAGYRPRLWTCDPPGGLDYTDVAGLLVPLEPLEPGDDGQLAGRVERDGLPVADLPVGLGAARPDKGAVGVAGQAARTDADGRFRFTGLAAGSYVVHPGFLVGDGAWYGGDGAVAVAVTPGAEAAAGTLRVLHEILPLTGADLVLAADDSVATFRWSAVPGAARYVWWLDGEPLAEAAAATATVTMPGLGAGLHRWSVTAEGPVGVLTGVTQVDGWFRRLP